MKDALGFEQVIQWYPGHMAAAMRRIGERMPLIDIVIEVIDSRLAHAGRNPMLDRVAGERPRLLVLTREDLADAAVTMRWLVHLRGCGHDIVAVNAKSPGSVKQVGVHLSQLAARKKRSQRAMAVGLPNSGKSTVINGLLRRSAARTEDRPGVTRATQWFRVAPLLELMDTPGILVPRIQTPQAQWMLAMTGAIPKERYDPQDVVDRFYRWLEDRTSGRTKVPDLAAFARARGFLRRGNTVDMHNAAQSYIKDFNDGKFGRISLEEPV